MSADTRSGSSLLHDVVLPDRYRIMRRIAQGGMASVWCARDTTLGRAVAIKLLGEQFVHDDTAVRRFKREARAAARLSGHPHVITIFDVGDATPTADDAARWPFIVMEHLSGGTVADALRVGAVGRELALRWLTEAAAALDYAHGRGVVHRDIKPGNLLLNHDRRLHVADFGIARVGTEDTITTTGQLFGTAAYLSPEQALGAAATEASDRYALAIVAYELLVGQRPFAAEHFAGQARQHIEQEPPQASANNHALPRAVDGALARGMAKRPEDRWESAGALVAELSRALREDAPTAARPVFVARSPRPAPARTEQRRPRAAPARTEQLRPRAVALAALAAAAFGIGATAGASTDGGSPSRSAAVGHTPRHAVSAKHVTRHASAAPTTTQTHSTQTQSPTSTQTQSPTSTQTQTATAGSTAAASPPPTAATLEARGHQLMLDGSYPAAIAVLQHVVAAAPPSSLTYAYALFDLGRSLRLAGDPQAAAVILQRRLQIPNQTDVVRRELELALREIGARLRGSGGCSVELRRRSRPGSCDPRAPA